MARNFLSCLPPSKYNSLSASQPSILGWLRLLDGPFTGLTVAHSIAVFTFQGAEFKLVTKIPIHNISSTTTTIRTVNEKEMQKKKADLNLSQLVTNWLRTSVHGRSLI